jgi:hypothetical protein
VEASGLAELLVRLAKYSWSESPPLASGPPDEERLHDEARLYV